MIAGHIQRTGDLFPATHVGLFRCGAVQGVCEHREERHVPSGFQPPPEQPPFPPPRPVGRVIVAVRHGKPDASSGARFGHEESASRVSPGADGDGELFRLQTTSDFARRAQCGQCATFALIRPGWLPFVNVRFVCKLTEDRCDGWAAQDVNFMRVGGAAHEGQTHHGVAEVVEFDDEEARFHRENHRRFMR